MSRKSITHCAMQVAIAMAERSEDPWTKVGCVALTDDNRMIATAYNGLLPGYSLYSVFDRISPRGWRFELLGEETRKRRLPFMVHAEQNLCSLIKRNEASWCVTTVRPCSSCLLLLAAHGIKTVVYLEDYPRDNCSELATFYHLNVVKYDATKD